MSDIWNIEFDEKKVQREEDFITSGYDLYIFEHACRKSCRLTA